MINIVIKSIYLFNSSIYEVALYEMVDSEMLLISKTETNQDLKFNFSALDTGLYSILVVKDGIYNPPIDISQRSFSVHNENVEIDRVNLEHDIIINIGEPILKKNISSIDFINNYFVNYNFTDGSSQFGVLDTVIYNINKDLSGTKHSIQINLDNDFESYLTDIFDFVIPGIIDTISPKILSCEIVDSKLSISLSEPLKECCADNAFYILDDEKNIPLDGYSYSLDDPLEIQEIVLHYGN